MLRNLFKHWLAEGNRPRAAAPPDRQQRLVRGLGRLNEGLHAEAERIYRSLLADNPADAEALHLLGHALRLQQRHAEAVDTLRRATALAPQSAEAHFSLGDALRAERRYHEALEAFGKALALRPDFDGALVSLADVLAQLERVDEAEDCYLRALTLAPDASETHYNFGNLLHRVGRLPEAVARYRRAVELKPDFVRAHSNLVYVLNFSAHCPPEEIFREHLVWALRHVKPLETAIRPHANSRRSDRVLRVGYVSANFRDHAVSYFFEPTLRCHDRGRFLIVLYSDVRQPDARTERLRGYRCVWREIAGQSDEAVAELVRRDEIDILVDLTGHTDNHRLLMFARKPAPIQVTWNGYANTTGMDAMDYRVVDHYTDPPGMTEHLHTERLVRLPEIYMAFEPPEDSPPVNSPPVLANGYVTFGSFNALAKVTPQVIAAWSQILRAVPDSRLLMLTIPEGRARARLLQAFAENGVAAARLEPLGRLPFTQFLTAHHRADIALDPFPFHGTTTTCQTLWMGVPVITLAGRSHGSRVGVSMLSNLGLAQLVAEDEEQYVAHAVALASDLPRLRELRSGMRSRMLASPLTNGERLTRYLEDAYRKMWEDYGRQFPGAGR